MKTGEGGKAGKEGELGRFQAGRLPVRPQPDPRGRMSDGFQHSLDPSEKLRFPTLAPQSLV